MIEFRDIIDLFHMSNNKSIIIVDNCETFEYDEDDITDKLSHIVDLIDIDDDRVKIYLENYTIPLYK